MNIKVLGTGCAKCKKLEENTKVAVQNLGLENVVIEKVEDVQQIMKYGVMRTPALVIDEQVKSMGKVEKPDAIAKLLK